MALTDGSTDGIVPKVNTRLVIDKAGRVMIPTPLREELQLEPGDTLDMEVSGEQIILRPVRGTCRLTKEHGVWVFHSAEPLPASATENMLDLLRKGARRGEPRQARMRSFFDTSALVPVFYGDHVHHATSIAVHSLR